MAGNIQNMRIGVCNVNFNGVDLGHTKGGVEFKYEPKTQALNADQYGSTPTGEVLTGEMITVKAVLAEFSSKQFTAAFPAGTISGQTLKLGANAGGLLPAYELILTPIAPSYNGETIVIWSAVVTSAIDVKYAPDNQRLLEVTFQAVIAESAAAGNRLGTITFVS